ncbi:hypothetical protein ACFY9N_05770 [Microbacterium sp. NPDC008134]|uniref:hypothetical protein n=1 Tax=Microbacterium sp. NPDC008134 TaxID=3364183 RepID=UPI0036E16B38
MFSYVRAFGIILAAVAATSGMALGANAAQAASAANLTELAEIQELTLTGDGTYAEQFASLERTFCADDIASVFGEACEEDGPGLFNIGAVDDLTISYSLNPERTHYVAAQQLKDDSVLVISDTSPRPVSCVEYNYDCRALVTDDEDLRNSVATWQTL